MSNRSSVNDADPERDRLAQYGEDQVPAQHRRELEELAGQVAKGSVSRRAFLNRAGAVGVGAVGAGAVLAACGGGTKSSSAASTTSFANSVPSSGGAIAAKYKNKTIGMPVYSYADENQITLASAAQQATDAAGLNWKWLIQDTQTNPQTGAQVMGTYISRKVDAVVDMVIPASFIAADVAQAKAGNIPVFGVYTFAFTNPGFQLDYGGIVAVDAAFISSYMLFNEQIRLAGKKEIKLGVLDTQLDVIAPRRQVMEGLRSGQPVFKEVAVANVDAADVVGGATKGVQALLSQHPDLDTIWVSYSPVGVPAAAAVQQAGNTHTKVYAHAVGSAGLSMIASQQTPLLASSWLDLVYTSWGLVDVMLQYFKNGKVDRFAAFSTNVVPIIAMDQAEANSSNVKKVQLITGKSIPNWLFQGGAYRQTFIDKWKEQYSS